MVALYYLLNVASLFNTVFSLKPNFRIKLDQLKVHTFKYQKEFNKTWK